MPLMKVLITTNVPSPYMVNFFQLLGLECDLTVIFEINNSTERNGRWNNLIFKNFNGFILKSMRFSKDSGLSFGILKHIIKHKNDLIIIQNSTTPTGILSIFFMNFMKITYVVFSEGGFANKGRPMRSLVKRYLFNSPKFILSSSTMGDHYFYSYGVSSSKIIRTPFSSILNKDIIANPIDNSEKKMLRKNLNNLSRYIVLMVGRFIEIKAFHRIIELWPDKSENVTLLIIGEGPMEEEYKKIIRKKNNNVVIDSFKSFNTLQNYYKFSDVFLHPTTSDVWGLVINEAMAMGLPVVATDRCIAALELIKDGENGHLIDYQNYPLMVNKALFIAKNIEIKKSMGEMNAIKIKSHTIDKMVESHVEFFEKFKQNKSFLY